jgi:small subunit ribosomal protein S1
MPAEWLSPVDEGTPDPAAGQEMSSLAEMLDQYLSCQRLVPGQIVRGVVVRVASTEVIVDIGSKCEGIVPQRDLELLLPVERDAIHVGDDVLACVVNPEDANGNIILSLSQAERSRDWCEAQHLLEAQEVIERQVVDSNRGGVIVTIGKIRGFVPGSQLALSHTADRATAGLTGDDRWVALIGETLQLKVIEVDQKRNRLILSERAALRDWRESQRQKLLEELTEGEVRRGRVINLVNFGAFVDLGGIDGLVHLSELSWKRVSHPCEVVEVGQEIEVYVLGVDRERQRVALSLKRLQPDPWISAEERYHEGQIVEGVITRLTKWGAFASIVGDEAIEGLIHVSELSEKPIVHPREVIQSDQVVALRVIGLDATHHRLALSLKQVAEGEFRGEDWRAVLESEHPESENTLSAALSEAVDLSEDGGLLDARG